MPVVSCQKKKPGNTDNLSFILASDSLLLTPAGTPALVICLKLANLVSDMGGLFIVLPTDRTLKLLAKSA